MLRRFQLLIGAVLFIALLAACGSDDPTPTPLPAEPTPTPEPEVIELSMISAWAEGISLETVSDQGIIQAIEDASNGRLRVVRAGGPEAVPTFQQLVPTRDGLFDVNSTTCAYHPDFTSLGCGWVGIKGSLDSRVACGMFDLMDDIYADLAGVKFIGGVSTRVGSRTYLTKPVDPATGRLDGIKLRAAGPTATAWVEALGGTAVAMPIPELYEALDRGLVEGGTIGGGAQLAVQFGWHEHFKYVVEQSVGSGQLAWVMNLDAWNSLTPDLQQGVLDGVTLANHWAAKEFFRLDQEALQVMADSGVEIVTLTPEAAAFVDSVNLEAQFAFLEENEPASYVQRLREATACVQNATG
jgi:TRAP-type mannitol/chloroaromatic compound transport system substrate-binding protein